MDFLDTLLEYSWALIIAGITIGMIIFITFDPADNLCFKETPSGYQSISSHEIDGILSCGFETISKLDYHFCVKDFRTTENHGLILIVTTCKPNLGFDANYSSGEKT